MLCPFHFLYLVEYERTWECPFPGCLYQRVKCPYCGFIVRIHPDGSFCLWCGATWDFMGVVGLYAKAFNIPYSQAKREVKIIMRSYDPTC